MTRNSILKNLGSESGLKKKSWFSSERKLVLPSFPQAGGRLDTLTPGDILMD